jgi:ArpU family phage transcriptional regulator
LTRNTRKIVEAALEKYNLYLLTIPEEELPRITDTYSIIPLSKCGSSDTNEQEIYKYIEFIQAGINRCTEKERTLIVKRYLEDEEVFDYEIYTSMGLSESRYYKIKKAVLDKLAFILGVVR